MGLKFNGIKTFVSHMPVVQGEPAVNDFVALFDEALTRRGRRSALGAALTALAVTGNRQGVLFVLDHMDQLLDQAETTSDGTAAKAIQATADYLVFRNRSPSDW